MPATLCVQGSASVPKLPSATRFWSVAPLPKLPTIEQDQLPDENVLQVMDTYIEKMQAFRKAIDEFDEDGIRGLIEEANRIKKIIR